MPAPLLLGCFFLSGASGLILELIWTRMLTLVFGSTTLAVSTVLTAFMGGLGLGSYLAGRLADRLRDPVKAYALAEAAIGAYALLVPWVIGFYPALNRALWAGFGDHYALLSVLRFAASAGLLIIPTTLMGATLPVLSRHFIQRPYELGRLGQRLGTLYAVNLFGAVTGAFLAGFVFLPMAGVRTTNRVAAAFDLSLAAAILLTRRARARHPEPRTVTLDEIYAEARAQGQLAEAPAAPPTRTVTPAARRAVLAAFAVSGATAMTLQGLWTRALAVVIGSSIYSFTLILLAFLVGLGAGSAVFARLAERPLHPIRWLATVHLGIGACVGLSYLLTDRLPYLFAWLLGSGSLSPDAVLVCQFVLACVAVLPATFLMGAIFPLSIRVAAGTLASVGRDVGNAYALNTVGAIVGSFVSGFVVLPTLGLQRGIYVTVCVGLALAALLFLVAPGLAARARLAGVAAAVALAAGGLALPRWNLVLFSQGFFRISIARDYIERRSHHQDWATPRLVFYEDGIATTVSVDQWGKTYSLKNNGKVDASSDADMPTQISVGLLPMLLYPGNHPPKVALVGFGSGVTAGSATQAPLQSLEVVELEPAIYRASRFFEAVNHRPLQNPKVTARVGDGRNFLGQRTDKFDVLISEPSNPWITGVSNLFTREYFQAIKSRLADDGIFCQWAQLYEMAPWNIKTIYRTLREEFPHALVFAAEDLSSDTILIASKGPLTLDVDRIARAFADPATRAEARRAGWESPHDIPAYLLLAPEELESFTAGSPVNTDDNALIELGAPRDLLGYARYDPYLAKVYGPQWPYGHLSELVRGYDGPDRGARRGALARSLLAHGKSREAELWARRAAEGGGAEAEHARLLLDLVATREDRDPEIPLAPEGDLAPPVLPPSVSAELGDRIAREYTQVDALVASRKYATAFKVLEQWPEKVWGKLGRDVALLSGFLDYKTAFYGDAIDELKPLAAEEAYAARRPALLYYLGRSYFANANYGLAVTTLERYVAAQRALGRALLPPSAAGAPPAPPMRIVPDSPSAKVIR
jgi:spermidine synthase